jgi:hypothetical protein
LKVRRTKPFVCIDVDYADHFRFQKTADVDAAAGTWLRCLAYTRAQEQDGVVPSAWIRRTFASHIARIDELVAVGLLRCREDGDYEIHAYAPRNQTRSMMASERKATRTRVSKWRKEVASLESSNTAQGEPSPVTLVKRVTEAGVTGDNADSVTVEKRVRNAPVPTSTSINSSVCISSYKPDPLTVISVPRASAPAHAGRSPLPPSERSLSGSFWLSAFTEGIAEATGRPCTAGRFYVDTLERIVTHHAPERDAPRASAWLKAQAKAFAAQWDGKHPAKGLTPDGLERWLNEGRQGPPDFGRAKIVQLPAEEWHEDDWSDLGARVD